MKLDVLLIVWLTYVAAIDDCGLVDELEPLVGFGRNATVKEFPWHVGVYSLDSRALKQICGGSLVRPDLVVTAAHCFDHLQSKRNPRNVTIAAGKLYRPISNDLDLTQQQSTVNTIIIPETYDSSWTNYQDDIAVAILTTAFTYNSYVRPICLDFEQTLDNQQLSPGNLGKVVGWGLTEKNTPSRILKVVELPFISISSCRELSDNRQYLTADKICAGYTNGTASVCRGDSGGGLVFPRREAYSRERYFLRGVVSVALKPRDLERACNLDVAAMFTRISAPQHERFLNNILKDVEAFRRSACLPIQANLVPAKSTEKSWNKCIEYQERLVYPCEEGEDSKPGPRQDRCGARRGGGGAAAEGEFPFMAFLTEQATPDRNSWKFPAAIISERFLITSAVRVSSRDKMKWARIRGHRIRNTAPARDLYRIARSIPHPEYRSPEIYHNVGLLETDRPMEFDRLAVPACLDVGRGVSLDSVTAPKWPAWPTDGEPQKASLAPVSPSDCAAFFGGAMARGYDNEMMTCYNPAACENAFYYGAPIVSRSSSFGCMYSLVGVVSSSGCEGSPDLYTRVRRYTPWIESVVWP